MDKLEADRLVRAVLRVGRGESIEDAARRVMSKPHCDPTWRVAAAVLSKKGSPWARMFKAAKAARRLERLS